MNKETISKILIQKCDEASGLLKLLSNKNRLLLLCHLAREEKTVTELVELSEITQSAVSQFLNQMKNEGLVESKRDGLYIRYKIADPKVTKLMRAMYEVFCND